MIDRSSMLLVDAEETTVALFRAVADTDYAITVASSLQSALHALAGNAFDLLVIAEDLPDGSGMDAIRHARETDAECTCILLASGGSTTAVDALRAGASDYFTKPLGDPAALTACLARVNRAHTLRRERRQLIEELTQKSAALEALAVRDPLTRLFSHAYLQEALEREIARSDRHEHAFSLLLVDIDNFTEVNDSLGHLTGNSLLRAFAELLLDEGREGDYQFRTGAGDVAARFGGDEFALILPETDRKAGAAKGERLRGAANTADYSRVGVPPQTISIGIASYPADGKDRQSLVAAAEAALYSAKATGRNRVVSYSSRLATLKRQDGEQGSVDARRLDALDWSIAGHEFNFVYQPILDARTRQAFAFEALVRPRHEAFPHPGVLIQTAERAGRIGPLGRALRQSSITALNRLPPDSILFINLHPQELHDPEFIAIEPFVAEWSGQIVFEITEVASITDYARVQKIIARLRGSGFRIALDDLGAGYSGINSLAMLEPDFVKLDMELVRSIGRDARTRRLAKHIVEFAAAEGMRVIAEGVETEDERRAVTDLGCDMIQGFYFDRGLPIEDILAKYANGKAPGQ